MTDQLTITNSADHERALSRLRRLMNNCRNDAESKELRSLAKAIQEYEMKTCESWRVKTDAVDELVFQLDMEMTTLDVLVPLFGGMDPFLEYVTRRSMPDTATKDDLTSVIKIDRDFLDAPFESPPGWEDIDLPGEMEPSDWRTELLAHRDAKKASGAHGDAADSKGTRERDLAAAL